MSKRIYPIRYKVENGSWTKEQLKSGGFGGCDRFLFTSVMESEVDGSVSYLLMGYDPKQPGNEMTVDDMFRCWAQLAHTLSEDLPEGGRRVLCANVHECIKESILKIKNE